ncbi:MAG: hypothetical protein GF308_16290 [Candidatus Heimdallarchaeota archaeon]|nr:hypothetical protein [Candidatus Heimdallarchaeota archaeon]
MDEYSWFHGSPLKMCVIEIFLREGLYFFFSRKMTDDLLEEPALIIDAKGQRCPIPSMRARLGIRKIPSGEIMKVFTTAPHSRDSIPRWCRNSGNELLSIEEKGEVNIFLIRRKE